MVLNLPKGAGRERPRWSARSRSPSYGRQRSPAWSYERELREPLATNRVRGAPDPAMLAALRRRIYEGLTNGNPEARKEGTSPSPVGDSVTA